MKKPNIEKPLMHEELIKLDKKTLVLLLETLKKTNARLNRRAQRAEKMWRKYKRRFLTIQKVMDVKLISFQNNARMIKQILDIERKRRYDSLFSTIKIRIMKWLGVE